jgi:hypothetical protein
MSTAFRNPNLVKAQARPMKVEAGKVHKHLGITDVNTETITARWWIPRLVDCTPHGLGIWERMHGGTHFPNVLLLASVVFDFVAWRSRRGLAPRFTRPDWLGGRWHVRARAVIAGLIMTRGQPRF